MELSKKKISKIMKQKNQSRKKMNKKTNRKKKNYKKSFRKGKSFNLRNKTLKHKIKLRGGETSIGQLDAVNLVLQGEKGEQSE